MTPPGTKKHNVVIATREKTYPVRRREAKRSPGRFRNRSEATDDAGGKGIETKQEVAACPACAEKHQRMPDPEVSQTDISHDTSHDTSHDDSSRGTVERDTED